MRSFGRDAAVWGAAQCFGVRWCFRVRCGGLERKAARRVATNARPRQHDHAGHYHRDGRYSPGCAHMVDMWAGESSRKPRRPRPYSRAFAGISLRFALRPKCRPWPPPCACHATPHASHLWDPMVFTTMRHAASLRSSNNCKCLIETSFITRGGKALSIKD